MGFEIRSLSRSDCREATAIRFGALDWGLLPLLGEGFYEELLKGTCDTKWGFGKVCEEKGGRIAGFIVAATDIGRYNQDILRRRTLPLILKGAWGLRKNYRRVGDLMGYLNYSGKVPMHGIPAEWLTMVVREQYRGMGLANLLTNALIDEYRRRGISEFRSTLESRNVTSCHLHERFGFTLLEQVELLGQTMSIYKYRVTEVPPVTRRASVG
jgi:GNAT superfamily N-acetyltransferase